MAEEKLLYKVEMAGQKAALDELAKLRKETEELKRENQSYNRSLKSGAQMTKETARESEKAALVIKEKRKRMKELTTEIENNGKSTEKMRNTLTAMRQEMQRMRVAGQQNTKAYRDLRKETGALDDQIMTVSREIKVFADDAMIMNTVVDTTKAMASGFQMVQSAQAMLGFESEKFEETMQKLIAAQTFINSLTQVQIALQKNSRVMIVGKVYATKLATAAQWAWNKAMTANPIGLIIAAVAALVAGVVLLVKNIDKVLDAFRKLGQWMGLIAKDTEEVTEITETYAESLERLNRASEKQQANLSKEIERLKAKGASIQEITERERELIQEQIRNAETRIKLAFIEAAALDKTAEERAKAQEDFEKATQELDDLYHKLEIFDIKETQRKKEFREKQLAEEKKKNDKLIEDEQRRADEIERIRQEEILRLEQQMMDELNRAELAQAELNLLLNDSLENRIALETVKHQQMMESRQDWTREEIALMQERHRQTIAELKNQNEQQAEVVQEGAKAVQEAEKVKAEAVAASLESTAKSLGAGAKIQAIFASFTKAAALAETIANIAKGTAQNASSAPFPANIPLIAGFLAQVGGLIGTIASIKPPRPPKFAKGGIIEGRSHSQGGTVFQGTDGSTFEAERGEYLAIVNKRDAARAQMLDEINQTHGKKFRNGGTFFAKGGMFSPRQDLQRTNIEDIVQETVEKITHIPVVLVERDVTTTQERVRRIRVAGDL